MFSFRNLFGKKCDEKKHKIIVSLTSYPPRIGSVHKTIKTLLEQTMRPDEIWLYLSSEEFPNGEKDLPDSVVNLKEEGLLIQFFENIGTHKKYYKSLMDNPSAVVITVDDDIYYDKKTVATLYHGFLEHPDCVIATRARWITVFDNRIDKYANWPIDDNIHDDKPSFFTLANGIGGILYPPNIMPTSLFDLDCIKSCIYTDDLWLKVNECYAGIKVIVVGKKFKYDYVEGTQVCSLWNTNVYCGNNDKSLASIIDMFKEKYGFDFNEFILNEWYKSKK